jgi:hypothetical protein
MQVGKSLVPLLLLAASMACTTGRANVIEDQPTLVVPPVPPRSIEPLPVVEPPPVEPEPTPAAPVTPPARTKPVARNDAKPEPKPEPPDTTTSGATLPNAPPPVAPLRTPATPTGPEAIRQVRDMVNRTESVLSRVDYQKLNPDRRLAYDTAKSFIQQAEEALKKEDLTLALSFAGRAENIAKQLEAR